MELATYMLQSTENSEAFFLLFTRSRNSLLVILILEANSYELDSSRNLIFLVFLKAFSGPKKILKGIQELAFRRKKCRLFP